MYFNFRFLALLLNLTENLRFKYIFDPGSGTASNVHPTFLSDSLHVVCIGCWPRQLFEKLVETANSSSRLAAENNISHLRFSY